MAARVKRDGRIVARDVVAREIVFASRELVLAEFIVVARETVARDVFGVVVRDVIVRAPASVLRDVLGVMSLRMVTFCDCFSVVFRLLELVVRTAASVTPMHTKHAVRKDRTFLILSIIIMITKNRVLGQVVFTRKNKKSRYTREFFMLLVYRCHHGFCRQM